MACRYTRENKYEVTMTNAMGKRRLLDGFKIGTTTVLANKLDPDELVVSFLGLPAYIMDKEILDKLHGRGVSVVSMIKRRMWPGTNIADGTRYLKGHYASECHKAVKRCELCHKIVFAMKVNRRA
ncbi:hypothetical protein JOB18_030447 [Solea senegalensis]|uniref:Uncharacterized protein n=1 Tax=Solea senegalensis TaxID=28829 RepID=A0AAV6RWB7_SOLSE|nr:hypothetical protein JOB18_030447 [Solea senegalensis]